MKQILLPCLLLLSFSLFSQVLNLKEGTTRAVVIGISDYEHDLIPDLKYAHRDAQFFVQWLQSVSGGSLPPEHIRLYLNEAATNAQIILSLQWLIDESKTGDRAFIYFSGHGDVERVTKYNNGYLLGYDSNAAVYGAGAFAVNYLKEIIANLSDNGVQVFFISDACRAGKLAGSTVNGSQVTAARLSQQFANEIKILSCQPDEFSLEGEQWGGGRGCFSYHLEHALYGLADQNGDAQINLMELGRYLQDKVSIEATPESQIPMVTGPPREKIAIVDDFLLEQKKEELANDRPAYLHVENRGFEEMILTEVDSNIRIIYDAFLAAIDSNNLMNPEGKSANDYYEQLMAFSELEILRGTIKRKFVVALMDEGQTMVNLFLNSDSKAVELVWDNRGNQNLHEYFRRAGEILGKEHYIYNDLKVKELFFLSKNLWHIHADSSRKWLSMERRRLLKEALLLDSTAAFIHHDLYLYSRGHSDALKHLHKAAELAPNWTIIYSLLGLHYQIFDPLLAIKYHKKAIAIDSTFIRSYFLISGPYNRLGQKDSSQYWKRQYLKRFMELYEKDASNFSAYDYIDIGRTLIGQKEYDQAEKFLAIGEQKTNGNFWGIHWWQTTIYKQRKEYDKVIEMYEKMIRIYDMKQYYGDIGYIYYLIYRDTTNAFKAFDKMPLDKITIGQFKKYIYTHKRMGNLDKSYALSQKLVKAYPNLKHVLIHHAEIVHSLGLVDTASIYFERLAENPLGEREIISNFPWEPSYIYKAISLHRLNRMDEFHKLLDTLQVLLPDDKKRIYNFALIYANTQQETLAIETLYQAIALGWKPRSIFDVTGSFLDYFLDPIRKNKAFHELIKKHFPEHFELATQIPMK